MRRLPSRFLFVSIVAAPALAFGWTSKPTDADALVRQPGTQPAQKVTTSAAGSCKSCHANYDANAEPMFTWQGSMMAQSAHDFFFWAGMTVAAQDAIWLQGRPNATDQCERCHLPKGWLEGRSEPTNGSSFTGSDFDGVQCDFCHKMVDPFFASTHAGTREGMDWVGYWDETNQDPNAPSQPAADACYAEDLAESTTYQLFDGAPLYDASGSLVEAGVTEAANGQFYVSPLNDERGEFADATPPHNKLYSRFHKSKYYCGTCHDVSNAHLANAAFADTAAGDGATVLPSESQDASSYFGVERTFSEFMLSDYGQEGGSPGLGPFAPGAIETGHTGDVIATCQDCHMPSVVGRACDSKKAKDRPTDSIEHPMSGDATHGFAGGNAFVPWILASSVTGSPNFDATNQSLLDQGAGKLTLDLGQGTGLSPEALLAGTNRALEELTLAASVQNLTYDPSTGAVSFRIQNNTGHKLLSGYPEGRRMFVDVQIEKLGQVIYEINPYDATTGTLKGLPASYSPNSPPLAPGQAYVDDLVYEAHAASTFTAESQSFHFALTTGFAKDNRIPPKGFRVMEADARQATPITNGAPDPARFTAAEYAGGYDDVAIVSAPGGDAAKVTLYYQTVSREYVEFLRDEIDGKATTLSSPTPSGEAAAYIAGSDPFFQSLAAWGDTIWQLWDHNKSVPGAAPILMGQALFAVTNACSGQPDGTPCDDADLCTQEDACQGGACVGSGAVSCDDGNPCTDDACDPNLGCVHTLNTAPCDDGDVCTTGDTCAFGFCMPGQKMGCDDGIDCTIDSCDPVQGCMHKVTPACAQNGGAGGTGAATSATASAVSGSSSGGAPSATSGSGGAPSSSSAAGAGGVGGSSSSGARVFQGTSSGCGCEVPTDGGASDTLAALATAAALALSKRRRRRQR